MIYRTVQLYTPLPKYNKPRNCGVCCETVELHYAAVASVAGASSAGASPPSAGASAAGASPPSAGAAAASSVVTSSSNTNVMMCFA